MMHRKPVCLIWFTPSCVAAYAGCYRGDAVPCPVTAAHTGPQHEGLVLPHDLPREFVITHRKVTLFSLYFTIPCCTSLWLQRLIYFTVFISRMKFIFPLAFPVQYIAAQIFLKNRCFSQDILSSHLCCGFPLLLFSVNIPSSITFLNLLCLWMWLKYFSFWCLTKLHNQFCGTCSSLSPDT